MALTEHLARTTAPRCIGRLLARNGAVSLINNVLNRPTCATGDAAADARRTGGTGGTGGTTAPTPAPATPAGATRPRRPRPPAGRPTPTRNGTATAPPPAGTARRVRRATGQACTEGFQRHGSRPADQARRLQPRRQAHRQPHQSPFRVYVRGRGRQARHQGARHVQGRHARQDADVPLPRLRRAGPAAAPRPVAVHRMSHSSPPPATPRPAPGGRGARGGALRDRRRRARRPRAQPPAAGPRASRSSCCCAITSPAPGRAPRPPDRVRRRAAAADRRAHRASRRSATRPAATAAPGCASAFPGAPTGTPAGSPTAHTRATSTAWRIASSSRPAASPSTATAASRAASAPSSAPPRRRPARPLLHRGGRRALAGRPRRPVRAGHQRPLERPPGVRGRPGPDRPPRHRRPLGRARHRGLARLHPAQHGAPSPGWRGASAAACRCDHALAAARERAGRLALQSCGTLESR